MYKENLNKIKHQSNKTKTYSSITGQRSSSNTITSAKHQMGCNQVNTCCSVSIKGYFDNYKIQVVQNISLYYFKKNLITGSNWFARSLW